MKHPQKMRITEAAFNSIINCIAAVPAESGGALFGSEKDYVVTRFIPDTEAKTSRATYSINAPYINAQIRELWENEGLSILGIAHSHPHGCKALSSPDLSYFQELLHNVSREKFFAPIVFSIPDGGFEIFPYVLSSDGSTYEPALLEIVHGGEAEEVTAESEEVIDFPSSNAGFAFNVLTFLPATMQVAKTIFKLFILGWVAWFILYLSHPFATMLTKLLSHATI